MSKNKIILSIITLSIIIGGIFIWNKLASKTKVALLNFQRFQTTSIVQSNTNKHITYEEIDLENLDKIKNYDFVLGFGMGLKTTEEQRAFIQKTADNGTPIYIHAATSPENNITNLDSITLDRVKSYLNNGNKKNYQSLANYIREKIDSKKIFIPHADTAVTSEADVLYHLDDALAFSTIEKYEQYLKEIKHYTKLGAKVAIVGGMNSPFSGNRANTDSLIVSLERSGINVYPVYSGTKRLEWLKKINPDAVIYFAHGRLAMGQADAAVDWLKQQNIPIFAPLSILQTEEAWNKDNMGMFGGFMSQSVIMPELDGAIYPYTLNSQEIDKNGLYVFKAIPERLKNFTEIVNNFLQLRTKNNSEKKLAIYYFKGVGQSTLTSQGLETVPSLYNFLKQLQSEGYKVENLPSTIKGFEDLLMSQGAVLSTYAEGDFENFLEKGNPALIEKSEYESWIQKSVPSNIYSDVVSIYGNAPGEYMSVRKNEKDYLAIARINLGNIVLLPQPMAALGSDVFAIVHGAKSAPPHTYIGSYLWTQHSFKADALLHFGTHGSLEFTPQKQVALGNNDWSDILVGNTPHFYYYTIGNVGESMMAKRRAYSTIVSYLTPAFMESNTRLQYQDLENKIRNYYKADEDLKDKASLEVKKVAVKMGVHRDLKLDSILSKPYSEEEIETIENFAEEIANEKMVGKLYVSGQAYSSDKIQTTVLAMSTDPIAYSLAYLDKIRGKVSDQQLKRKSLFTEKYLNPSKQLVNKILNGTTVDNNLILGVTKTSDEKFAEAQAIMSPPKRAMPGAANKPATEYTKEQKEEARAILEVERTLQNVLTYKQTLEQSPQLELKALINALNGGYIAPSSGGDAVANPNATPTGRNLYSINAEATPSEIAWDKGVALVNATILQYKKKHNAYPRKVSYTFWSSEFIESEGATIAQVLYMLGIEPVRDAFGRVSEIRLIPSQELGRPRIDVVVQTSGQFRDLAASRLSLISKAVEMAAASTNDKYENYVANSTIETEHLLVEQGVSPKDARDLSTQRIFGGINGMYGTGIQEMVTSGDKWENESEIAETYIHNMGAVYGSEKDWGNFNTGLLKAVLHNTDAVVQPRQSNTWGALSLDHVFEFMGGVNLAVRNVTGKDPEAYFADYRNRNNAKMQDLKQAIGVESRSTIFNPEYIKEIMKGGAEGVSQITDVVTNTYGWNVMKPDVIDNEMWDEIHNIYVKDNFNLGISNFIKEKNPAALQEITAVMLETSRKGMWKASDQQINELVSMHTQLVKEFGSAAGGFSGENLKLQDYIAQKADPTIASEYKKQLNNMKHTKSVSSASENVNAQNGMVLKKEQVLSGEQSEKSKINGILVVSAVLILFAILMVALKRKRTK